MFTASRKQATGYSLKKVSVYHLLKFFIKHKIIFIPPDGHKAELDISFCFQPKLLWTKAGVIIGEVDGSSYMGNLDLTATRT